MTTNPRRADRTVMSARADMAARKTVSLFEVIAIMAAMKKVLSPSSETRMTERASTKPCRNPLWRLPASDRVAVPFPILPSEIFPLETLNSGTEKLSWRIKCITVC